MKSIFTLFLTGIVAIGFVQSRLMRNNKEVLVDHYPNTSTFKNISLKFKLSQASLKCSATYIHVKRLAAKESLSLFHSTLRDMTTLSPSPLILQQNYKLTQKI